MPFASKHPVPSPADDWMVVLIRPQKKTEGGVVVPESAYDELPTVEVMAVGPGIRSMFSGERIPMDVQIGDIIYCIAHFMIIGPYEEEKRITEVKRPALVTADGQATEPEEPEIKPKLAFTQRKSVVGWKSRAAEVR